MHTESPKSVPLLLILTLVLASALLVTGCATRRTAGQTSEPVATPSAASQAEAPSVPVVTDVMPPGPSASMAPGTRYRSGAFVRDAGLLNAADIAIAGLARTHSASSALQGYADSVSDEQRTISIELQRLAGSVGESVPRTMSAEDKKTYDRLVSLKGDAFDQAFVTAMMQLNQRFLDVFGRAADQLPQDELRQFAVRTLSSLRMHMAKAQQLDQQIGTAPDDTAPKR